MANPWLSIPLADYEGHMSSPGVQQLDVLSDLFAEALAREPSSVAVLGVAGGNGLDRIDPAITTRVVGIDVNLTYLEEVRKRYAATELRCVDLSRESVKCEPVQLVHAALIFEHTGATVCLENAIELLAEEGALSVVLQLPAKTEANVSVSPFPSIQKLSADFALIDPGWLTATIGQRGFQLQHQTERPLPGGKGLWFGLFSKKA